MKISVTGRHMEVPESLKRSAVEKMEHLTRFFENIQRAELIFAPEKDNQFSAEMILHAPRGSVLVIHAQDKSAVTAFDSCLDKMERQLTKLKDKLRGKTTKGSRLSKKLRAAATAKESESASNDNFGDLWW